MPCMDTTHHRELDSGLADTRDSDARRMVAEERIPIVEEQLTIGKRQVATGEVRVRTHVEEVPERLTADLVRERVEVERVPVGRVVEAAPEMRTEGDVTVIPVLEERLVVSRQLVLVEELRVRRVRTQEPVAVEATRRVMRAEVERGAAQTNINSNDEVTR